MVSRSRVRRAPGAMWHCVLILCRGRGRQRSQAPVCAVRRARSEAGSDNLTIPGAMRRAE